MGEQQCRRLPGDHQGQVERAHEGQDHPDSLAEQETGCEPHATDYPHRSFQLSGGSGDAEIERGEQCQDGNDEGFDFCGVHLWGRCWRKCRVIRRRQMGYAG